MNTRETGQNIAEQERINLELLAKEQLIYQMLTESTGRALGDSGDIYGRHWEKNQAKSMQDFQDEPAVSYTINKPFGTDRKTIELEDIEFTISVFHYLKDSYFRLDPLCDYFNRHFVPADNWESDHGYGLSSEGEAWLESWGFEFKEVFNTANDTDFLSQTLQGTFLDLSVFKSYDKNSFSNSLIPRRYVLLQIHQGCDIRGGYTDARLFYLPAGCLPRQCVHGYVKGCEFNNWKDERSLQFITEEPEEITQEDSINMFYSVC